MKGFYSIIFLCLGTSVAEASESASTDTIVVTATRTEVALSNTTVPIAVIDREQIELSGASDLAELLRFQAGIDIGRNGGPGQSTSVFLRGTESNHVLILIDGVRMNPGTIGGGAIQHISPEFIERIEIVKGARSALYGTEAIGGVINIITRRVNDTRLEAGLGGGSFDTRSGFLSGGWRDDSSEIGLSVDATATDGFSPSTASDISRGYDNVTLALHATHRFDNDELGIRHWSASGNVEYLDFFLTPVDQDFTNSTTAIEWQRQFGKTLASRLVVSWMQDDIEQNQSPDFVQSDRFSVDWQLDKTLNDHVLTVGVFAMDETAESLSFGSGFKESTQTHAVFVQNQWSNGRHRTFTAVRLSDHETFGTETTWNLEYGFDISDAWRLTAGAGRAFRAPDASDRFGFGGSPDLAPEVSLQQQLGLRFSPAERHTFSVEAYSNRIDDLIDFDFATFTLQNIAEADIAGIELGYSYTGDSFAIETSVVNQKAEDKDTGARLLRRAEQSMTLSYTQNIGPHRLGLQLLASGDREDFGATPLPGYLLANLVGQFRAGDQWRVNARIENLTDKNYETAAGFVSQERSAYVELRYLWN